MLQGLNEAVELDKPVAAITRGRGKKKQQTTHDYLLYPSSISDQKSSHLDLLAYQDLVEQREGGREGERVDAVQVLYCWCSLRLGSALGSRSSSLPSSCSTILTAAGPVSRH